MIVGWRCFCRFCRYSKPPGLLCEPRTALRWAHPMGIGMCGACAQVICIVLLDNAACCFLLLLALMRAVLRLAECHCVLLGEGRGGGGGGGEPPLWAGLP